MTQAILLIAHGARDPRWAEPIERIAESLRSRVPRTLVRTAYLEFLAPNIPQALDALHREGVRKLRIVPIFLGAGGHVVNDIAGLVDAARGSLPGLEIAVDPPIGALPQVTEAIASAIAG